MNVNCKHNNIKPKLHVYHPKLLDWHYTDFKQTLHSDMTLSTIQQILQEQHGTMHNLKLPKYGYTESNETVVSTKETTTLKEVFDDDKGKQSNHSHC